MPIRLAINGVGRIGRAALKIALDHPEVEVVALNNLSGTAMLAHLLKYDTVYGRYEREVGFDEDHLIIDGKKFPVLGERDPAKLPWKELKVDVVIEATGKFRTKEKAAAHLEAGAKRVVLSAPPKSEGIQSYVNSVNDDQLGDEAIISNASCTTNCISPAVKIIHDNFGIHKAVLTTIHSYTADQNLIDSSHKSDFRRARAAAQNIVPTTTGAAKATTKTIPDLTGVFDGLAIRVPTPVVSLSDITMLLKKKTTVEEVNEVFKKAAAEPRYQQVLTFTEDPIVSSDLIGNPYASIIDLPLTKLIDGDLLKVIAWYDNEWGYSQALINLCIKAGK